ncbi:MAG: Hint domain-containing protein [Ruegeria sp.]|uniref:Hint domain-containing protein n=1 Tax=Ruegeria sp. TaxID=1879320 RepID=UPI00349EC77C
MPTTFEVMFLGTFADIDPTEGNDDMENAASLVGLTFGSAADPLAFGNQRTLTPVNFSGGNAGVYDTDNNLSNDTFSLNGGPAQTFDSAVLYNATITYTDGTPPAVISAVLMQDTDGNLYLAPESTNNADQAALTAAPIQSLTINSVIRDFDISGLSADRAATDFVCFAKGTLIRTAQGNRRVEDLQPGDLVCTLDRGMQPIRWIGSKCVDLSQASGEMERLLPVRITAGALGGGLPRRDLLVSRQHRLLVSSKIAAHMFGTRDVLVAAIKLSALPGIYVDEEVDEVEYFHLLFDRHEVIFAEDAPAESLYTGAEALKAVSPEARQEILTLLPELEDEAFAPAPAIPVPQGRRQKQLVTRHAKNDKPLLETYPAE